VTRRISIATRKELIEAVGVRYREAPPSERTRILDELVALAGYHRKHAIRLLAQALEPEQAASARNRVYDEAVRQALILLWEAADRICGKRLKILIPVLIEALERHGHLQLDAMIRQKVLQCRRRFQVGSSSLCVDMVTASNDVVLNCLWNQ
jgi:hypothetical protein